MKRGYFVAILGLVGFIAVVIIAASLDLQGPAGAIAAYVAMFVLGFGLWAGTTIVAVEKGYNVAIGIVLGFFAPLGLLILTLMPDRRARRHVDSKHQ